MNKIILLFLLSVSLLLASIDINKASKTELMQIKGIGDKKAQSIINYRKKHGKFKSVNDLKNVKGIGEGIVKNVKNDTKSNAKKSTKKVKSNTKTHAKAKKAIKTKAKNPSKTKAKKSTKSTKKKKASKK